MLRIQVDYLKKITNESGFLIEFLKKNELDICSMPFGQIYVVNFNKQGVIRGNHFHLQTEEWFLIIDGVVEVRLKDIETGEFRSFTIDANKEEPQRLRIKAKVAHGFRSISSTAILLAHDNKMFNNQFPDRYKYDLFGLEKTEGPKVSVIITTYNLAHYICETIDSVLAQTYTDYEILVIDDGSTDNTQEVLSKYNGKIRYFYKENEGECATLNKGIELSRGKYIAFIDADDLWFPDKLRLQVNFLEQNPDYGAVYSDTYLFDNKGNLPKTVLQTHKAYSGQILDKLCLKNFIQQLTMVVRKECFEKIGLFDPEISLTYDYDMWLRISREYKIGLINIPLAKYRLREGSISRNSQGMCQGFIQCVDRAISRSPRLKEILGLKLRKRMANFYFRLGCALFTKKQFRKAKEAFWKSIVYWPLANFEKFYLFLYTILFRVAAID